MSRLLSLLLLYKSGFDAGKYISFEEQINGRKSAYYEALRQSSLGWETGVNDYAPFMREFILTLFLCYKELDGRFALLNEKKVSKRRRVELTVLDSLVPISKAEILRLLPDVSATTVEAALSSMVKGGAVKRVGSNRGARYLRA